jgi:hypothetical protein
VKEENDYMRDVVIHYEAYLYGEGEKAEKAICIIEDTYPGTEVYECVRTDLYRMSKDGGFTKDEYRNLARKIIEKMPKYAFTLDILRYEDGKSTYEIYLNYFPPVLHERVAGDCDESS